MRDWLKKIGLDVKKFSVKVFFVDTVVIVIGSVFYALGIYTFASGGNFAPGGISGVAIIINAFTGLPIGLVSLAINVPLMIICGRAIGAPFLLKTGYTMLITTLFLDVVFPLFPKYTGDPLLAALFTGVSVGGGIALIYMRGASTGGTDFLILSIKKIRPHFSVGRISLFFDALVIAAGAIAFREINSALYGIVACFTTSLTMDNIIYGMGSSKMAMIITDHGQSVAQAISAEVERGSTLVDVKGSYTGNTHQMLLCACSKSQIYKVRTATRAVDPQALFMVTEISEAMGEGFEPPKVPGSH